METNKTQQELQQILNDAEKDLRERILPLAMNEWLAPLDTLKIKRILDGFYESDIHKLALLEMHKTEANHQYRQAVAYDEWVKKQKRLQGVEVSNIGWGHNE